jgi:hypothetical protein
MRKQGGREKETQQESKRKRNEQIRSEDLKLAGVR